MFFPEIIHHGATQYVTGSCHQLCMDAANSLLIDCGALQASEPGAKDGTFDFSPADIKALIVTHVHFDHVGRIPQLLASGYRGPILCSEPSAHLLPLVMEDLLKFEFHHDRKQIERYLAAIEKRVIALPFDHWFDLVNTDTLVCKVRLQRAGHILGSAYVECDLRYPLDGRTQRVVFSGDLGADHAPMLPAPKSPERADIWCLKAPMATVFMRTVPRGSHALSRLSIRRWRIMARSCCPRSASGALRSCCTNWRISCAAKACRAGLSILPISLR
ncbi:Metallo-beta-lactamase [Pseudomonas cichorii]|uniref:Metallo-beta-lactamase n=1 Tax=Pseudomonas cichorii TaxID=36746 RepID=A0A3M4LWL9_PSECI|nr:Metallo-beta-lactamase [Pseudomonas cichorii]